MSDVSVIIPTWNRAQLLQKAIRSALAQTNPPLEILVCDDGSTDESKEMLGCIDAPQVRWLPGSRGGRPAIPRNRGIKECCGEWIAFLDNDDEWFPDKLEKQLRLAEETGCRAVCSNALRFVPGIGNAGDYLDGGNGLITFDTLLDVNRVICSSMIVHRSVLAMAEGFPEEPELKALEDYASWLRIAVFTDVAYLPEPLLLYRDEAYASVRSDGVNVWEQRRRVFHNFLSWGERAGIAATYLRKIRRRLLLDQAERLMEGVAKPVKRLKKALIP